jgi:hypothetical protein
MGYHEPHHHFPKLRKWAVVAILFFASVSTMNNGSFSQLSGFKQRRVSQESLVCIAPLFQNGGPISTTNH